MYSYSFEPNPGWSRVLPSFEELWAYLKKTADKYDLPQKMTFGVTVERCEWVEESQRWRMYIRHDKTGQYLVHECQFLFAGTGQLVEPRKPDIPGIENFKGPVFHASRWRKDVDLKNKNVAVLGNGCTAAQIVPNIVKETKHLTQYFRSKHWILPPIDQEISSFAKFIFRKVPGTLILLRLLAFLFAEEMLTGFTMDKKGAAWRKRTKEVALRYIRETAPEKYHDMLIPDFEVGCKRRIFDPGYLPSLNSENLTLTNDPILEVLPDGIRTKDGVTKTDVIVLAIGYSTNQFLPGINVVGRNGSIADHWSKFGGPEAYNCTVMNGFPNLFVLLGKAIERVAKSTGHC